MTSLPVTLPAPELPAGPRAALVVAVGSYTDAALARLESTAHDAAEMAEVLAASEIGSFEVTSVVDRTAQEVRLAVEDFLEGRGRAVVIVAVLVGALAALRVLRAAAPTVERSALGVQS